MDGLQQVYKKQLPNFVAGARNLTSQDEIGEYVGFVFPEFNRPFQTTALQLGQAFYAQRRRQASIQGGGAPSFDVSIRDFDFNKTLTDLNPINLITGLMVDGLNKGNILSSTSIIQQVATKSVAQASRESVLILDETDDFSTKKVSRRARAQGCNFCKLVILRMTGDGGAVSASKFHNNCSCVVDIDFEPDDPNFTQSWEESMKRDVEKAEKLLEDGEAGERTVQVGSREWDQHLRREMSTKSREYRKSRNWSSEKQQQVRDLYKENMNNLAHKIAGGFELTPVEKNNLYQWGMTEDRLNPDLSKIVQPYRVEMTKPTTKNMTYALDIVQGKRGELGA